MLYMSLVQLYSSASHLTNQSNHWLSSEWSWSTQWMKVVNWEAYKYLNSNILGRTIHPTRSFNWPNKSLSFHWIGHPRVKYMAEQMVELGKQQCALWRWIKHIYFKELFWDRHINDINCVSLLYISHHITVHFHFSHYQSIVRCVTLCWDPGRTSSSRPPLPSTLTGDTLTCIPLEDNPKPGKANIRDLVRNINPHWYLSPKQRPSHHLALCLTLAHEERKVWLRIFHKNLNLDIRRPYANRTMILSVGFTSKL